MDRLTAMQLFTRIVDRRSFTLAAADLNLPRSTATEAIKTLEARLNVRLLQRTTRTVRPTLDGEAYYTRCQSILAEIEEAEASFHDARPGGILRVDVHGTLARHFVLPGLPGFLARYPDLELHLSEGDRLVDLVREGIDCVLRVGALGESAMIYRKVASLPEVTCASPAYLALHGHPLAVEDLGRHRAVAFQSSATGAVLPFAFVLGTEVRRVPMAAAVTVTAAETYVAAARLGLGLIQVPRYHVAEDLQAGRLVEVLPDMRAPALPVSLLYPQRQQVSPRVRVFMNWLIQEFATHQDAEP